MSEARRILLGQGWSWKQRNDSLLSVLDELNLPAQRTTGIQEAWTPAQAFPSEIHVELLENQLIPDPFVGFNEHKVQWIGETEWLYKCHFPFSNQHHHLHAILEFEGLDTICDVYLNGIQIIKTDNAFRTYTFPIALSTPKNLLRDTNTLLLHFKPAKLLAKAEEAKYGKVRAGSTNLGDPSRVYVRKPQYDWRWDWGPELMTCGPYRPITLKTFTARIADIHPRASVLFNKDTDTYVPTLKMDLEIDGWSMSDLTTLIMLKDPKKGSVIRQEEVGLGTFEKRAIRDAVVWTLEGEGMKLWWPVRYGEQCLYNVEVILLGLNGVTLDTQVKRIGFRTVELVQESLAEPDQYGTGSTFLFEINGVRMFIGGSNWVPADSFLTTITDRRYRAWLTLLRDGNQNMIRLWGGGVYEPDVFYDICDELGILVWQDFQFSCGVYPAHDEFVASVRREAEDNVKRLRHHPSMTLFCGNNEDYQMVLQWGIGELPARKLYEEVFPEVVATLTDPPLPYHRGSPYGGKGWDTADPTMGDVHQWNVWGGKELPYQEYDKLGGRFVSEFGIPSLPDMRTIAYWMDDAPKKEWHAQSKIMAQHSRAGAFERRFAIVMNENFRVTEDLETYGYRTRLMQSEAVSYAYQAWRRKWGGRGKEYTSGVLVWQLNDCWPVTSWAIIDYFLRPKPIYFTIKRALASLSIGITRTVIQNRENDRPRQFYEFGATQSRDAVLDIWASNTTLVAVQAKLELSFFDLNEESGWTHSEIRDVELPPNQSTDLVIGMKCLGPTPKSMHKGKDGPLTWTSSHLVVVSARLLNENGEVLARYSDWPQPFKYLDMPNPRLRVTENGEAVKVKVTKPVKGVWLSVPDAGEEVRWSGNALDVVPGDDQVVIASGLKGRQVWVAWLGSEHPVPCAMLRALEKSR